jgi:hypothetical protein
MRKHGVKNLLNLPFIWHHADEWLIVPLYFIWHHADIWLNLSVISHHAYVWFIVDTMLMYGLICFIFDTMLMYSLICFMFDTMLTYGWFAIYLRTMLTYLNNLLCMINCFCLFIFYYYYYYQHDNWGLIQLHSKPKWKQRIISIERETTQLILENLGMREKILSNLPNLLSK